MIKLVITNIQRNPFTQKPVLVTITVFSSLGVKQLEIPSLPSTMFSGELEIGQELVFVPKTFINLIIDVETKENQLETLLPSS